MILDNAAYHKGIALQLESKTKDEIAAITVLQVLNSTILEQMATLLPHMLKFPTLVADGQLDFLTKQSLSKERSVN